MQLQARFFVSPSGLTIEKARPLRRSERFKFYLSSDRRCRLCGVEVKFGGITASPYQGYVSGHVDHILARSRGGSNEQPNLQLLCISCNTSKGAR